jgi:hypothetical protein
MYSWHIFLLPVAVVALVGAHVLLVRKHGIVPPFTLDDRKRILAAAATDGAAPALATEGGAERPAEHVDVGDDRPEPASPPTGEAESAG